jgi:hypothetical protein
VGSLTRSGRERTKKIVNFVVFVVFVVELNFFGDGDGDGNGNELVRLEPGDLIGPFCSAIAPGPVP